jgi:hypothetical protein
LPEPDATFRRTFSRQFLPSQTTSGVIPGDLAISNPMSALGIFIVGLLCVLGSAELASAQERPYFVTYDHYLEERGNLEIAVATTTEIPKKNEGVYAAPWLELEYGLTGCRAVLGGCHDATRGTWVHRVARREPVSPAS